MRLILVVFLQEADDLLGGILHEQLKEAIASLTGFPLDHSGWGIGNN